MYLLEDDLNKVQVAGIQRVLDSTERGTSRLGRPGNELIVFTLTITVTS